jgi:perosamine synthetase
MTVPFFRPAITDAEVNAVVETLRSGWLTTGPRTKEFEAEFARYVGAKHAIALNSCTAALHLALEAIGLGRGDLVLVPTMTFAATAEVVRYFDATPVLVDCDAATNLIDVAHAKQVIEKLPKKPKAIIPMHYGGQMADVDAIRSLDLPVIEDAAHTLPASYRGRRVGTTALVTCFSFYANKCITTGEGGMAVTDDDALADRMRVMSLHGISKDAWKRFSSDGSWYYEIDAPGFKYNMTDVAAALGLHQLRRADELWRGRKRVVEAYRAALKDVPGIELPVELTDREHSWHLFPIRLDLTFWTSGRDAVIAGLKARGITTSVHYMPLHLHPYYRRTYDTGPGMLPQAESVWPRQISLPLFPTMTDAEVAEVAAGLRALAGEQKRR